MIDTKAMIIHQILKFEGKPFKLHNVYEPMGLSAQNASNHLRRLVNRGVVIKNGTVYSVPSQERLVDELVGVGGRDGMEKVVAVPPFLNNDQVIQQVIDHVVRARVLDKPNAGDMHVVVNQKIDEVVDQMKRAKKWLNNKQYTISRAENGFDEKAWDEMVKAILEGEY